MKIKSIAAICKKNKNIAIFERYSDDGDILTQYIGDGSAVYPVVGLPQLDKESLLTIFDVPEKDRDNYFVKTLGVPVGISFEDTDETERHVEREGISIIYSGRTLKPIRTTRGLVFIESRYLSPVADVLDVLELYERRTAEGAPYIVAKAGFLLQAALLSSENMCWCTPQDFFDKLNAEFGFVLDPAATDKTAKCSLYYTPETDGLSQSWDRGGAVFCNPPYGREIGKWVQKAFEEARGGVSDCFTYPSADGYGIFSRLHLRESGNPLRARAATVHGRRRERRRSRAIPFNGSYL